MYATDGRELDAKIEKYIDI